MQKKRRLYPDFPMCEIFTAVVRES